MSASASAPGRKIRVLVAEDSSVARMLLVHLLESDPQIEVIGAVRDGEAAVRFLDASMPDVVVMDIHMPRMDGFEATRRIMETHPMPIVVCSAISNVHDAAVSFRALEAGAIACIEKPLSQQDPGFAAKVAHLLATVKLMSEVKVVRRRAKSRGSADITTPPRSRMPVQPAGSVPIRVVGIGASTGGPPVLQAILSGLPRDFPVPVLVVQHIAPGFLPGMVEWLAATTPLKIQIATHGSEALPGHVYLAPDDYHMGLDGSGRVMLSRTPAENHVRPAVSYLLRSLVKSCGAEAIGVLLTGMGRDGAEELKNMKDRGAITIAQDQRSSVVHGMPGAAIALDGASQVLAADRIAQTLVALTTSNAAPCST